MDLERFEIIKREGLAENLLELVRFDLEDVYTKVLVKFENYSCTLICVRAGSSIDTHISSANCSIQVLEGSGVCISAGKQISLSAGTFVFTPPYVENSLRAEEDLAFVLCLAH